MKIQDEQYPLTEEGFELRFRERPSSPFTVQIPNDALTSLTQVASRRDMSIEALVKLYIGQGLRQDLSRLAAERLLEKTEEVLTRHLRSEQEVNEILNEIRVEAK